MTPFEKDTSRPQRILSLWFPHLPADRVRRQRLGRSWRLNPPVATMPPLVLSGRDGNTQRIAALDERASQLKLRPGLGIAEARAMHPSIEIVEADPDADRRLLEGLADWCDRYTPLVALDGEDGLFLDITGCAHLFGGERGILDDLLSRFFHQGFAVRAGLASTPGAAWAAARFGATDRIEPGSEEDLLAPLPLAALRLDSGVCAGLEGVGLRTAGAIMATPRAPLARRFGRGVMLRLDQALGHVEEAISPRLPVPPLMAERRLAEPISTIEDIEALAVLLAGRLKTDLERRGEGATRLQLQLFRVDGAVSRLAVGASRPLRDPGLIGRLFHERLAALASDLDAGYGFDLVRLSALVTASLAPVQDGFDGATGASRDDVALFADRVRARLGDDAVCAVRLAESHVPERAAAATAPDGGNPGRGGAVEPSRRQQARDRPVRLLDPPEWIEVSFAGTEHRSMHFRWRSASYQVAKSEGPERVSPEWWREEEKAQTRDYFKVEDPEGRRYWLYRQEQRWFIQGMFA